MVRTQIQLTEEQARQVRELATERGVSMAEVIREAVDTVLRTRARLPRAERMRRAREAFGTFTDSEVDVSVNHDRYLDEIYGAH